MSKKSAFIRDGQNRKGYLAETPLFPAVRFAYRPFFVSDRSEYLATIERLAPRAVEKRNAEMLKARLVSWDIRDENDDAAPITVTNLLALEPALQIRLSNVVLGFVAGDEDPEASDAEKSERADDEALALSEGVSVEGARQEREKKT